MRYLAIKDYWKHQHYHKRGAPWIKLYAGILTDAALMQLPEAAQAQLMKLWVLASQFGHPLPNNPKLLAGKIGTTGKFYLASMIAAGFIVACDTDEEVLLVSSSKNASKMLAESAPDASDYAHASARSRESRELEGERETTLLLPPTAAEAEAEAALAVRLDTDADRNALTALLARATARTACLAALTSMLTGNDPAVPRPSTAVFGQALRDLVTNGVQPSARKIRTYIADADRAVRAQSDVPPSGAGAGPRPGTGARAFATTLAAIEDL